MSIIIVSERFTRLSSLLFFCYNFLICLYEAQSSEWTLPYDGEGRECTNGICVSDLPQDRHRRIVAQYLPSCQDLRPYCTERADSCQTNWKFMHAHCPRTCQVCHNQTRIIDLDDDDPVLKSRLDSLILGVTGNEHIVDVVGADFGEPQVVDSRGFGIPRDDFLELMQEVRDYMMDVVLQEKRYEPVRDLCKNKSPECAFFGIQGECVKNPSWMEQNCAPICFACEQLHIESRCPLNRNAKNAWYPGDLNKMFERIISDPEIVENYQPKIWSRPRVPSQDSLDDGDADDDDAVDSPWVITLENFITPQEAQFLIDQGAAIGYHRSADVGKQKADGTYGDDINDQRTSENAWCENACADHPVTVDIMQRIERITGIPATNSESLQLLRYDVGQFYGVHHDYIEHEANRLEGPRILTVFLYLNNVEEGGETRFDDLDLKVAPKVGRALIWPSVTDEDPHAKDEMAHHEALPVIKGVKYGANAWLHLRDSAGPLKNGC